MPHRSVLLRGGRWQRERGNGAVAGVKNFTSTLARGGSLLGDCPRIPRFRPGRTGTSRKVSSFPDPLFLLLPLNCHFCQESSLWLLPVAPLITITRNNPAVMSSKLLLPVVKGQVGPAALRPAEPRLHPAKKKAVARAVHGRFCVQRCSRQRFYELNKNKTCVRHRYHQNVAIVRGEQAIDCAKL